ASPASTVLAKPIDHKEHLTALTALTALSDSRLSTINQQRAHARPRDLQHHRTTGGGASRSHRRTAAQLDLFHRQPAGNRTVRKHRAAESGRCLAATGEKWHHHRGPRAS